MRESPLLANRDMNGYSFRGNMTVKKCSETCLKSGFKYAGVQYADYCFCDNFYGRYGKADNCNMPCSGDKNEICGGAWANSVYELMGKRDTEEESEITKPIDTSGVDGIVDVDTTTVDEIIVEGKTKTSTTYAPNNKGDAFKGGHWAGASGGSDWLQKDFSSPQLVTGVYVGEASTDITTEGFRLVFKLKKPNGEWVTIDELNDVNINRTALSGGAIGKSIPSYTKRLSSAIEATAFRLEFYGNGWFDATDIRIYTSKISNPPKIDVDGIVDIDSEEDEWHKAIVVTTDNNIFPDPSVRDEEADSHNYVIDGDESHAWVRLFF